MADDTFKHRPKQTSALAAAVLVALALLLGACGDDDSGSEESSTTEADATGADPTDSGSAGSDDADPEDSQDGESGSDEGASGADGSLVGQWTADAAETLAANTANMSMPAGITCSGPLTLEFVDDGTFTAGGSAECGLGGFTVTGTMNTTGNWATTDDGRVEITGATSDGSFDVPGMEIPPMDVVSDGTFAYTVAGDTLSVVFEDPSVGEVTQVWTRA